MASALAAAARVVFEMAVALSQCSERAASREAATLGLARASMRLSKASRLCSIGTRPPPSVERRMARARSTASRSAWLAPCPLNGDIGWAASPMRVHRLP